MTIANAQHFINRVLSDYDLVHMINTQADSEAVSQVLADLDLRFNMNEFKQAYFHLLTLCQTPEQAEAVTEIKLWWDMLGQTLKQTQ